MRSGLLHFIQLNLLLNDEKPEREDKNKHTHTHTHREEKLEQNLIKTKSPITPRQEKLISCDMASRPGRGLRLLVVAPSVFAHRDASLVSDVIWTRFVSCEISGASEGKAFPEDGQRQFKIITVFLPNLNLIKLSSLHCTDEACICLEG